MPRGTLWTLAQEAERRNRQIPGRIMSGGIDTGETRDLTVCGIKEGDVVTIRDDNLLLIDQRTAEKMTIKKMKRGAE